MELVMHRRIHADHHLTCDVSQIPVQRIGKCAHDDPMRAMCDASQVEKRSPSLHARNVRSIASEEAIPITSYAQFPMHFK